MIQPRKVGASLALAACLALLLAPRLAQATRYDKGGYHYEVAPAPAWVTPASLASRWDEGAPGAAGASTERWRTWLSDVQIDRRHGAHAIYRDMAYQPLTTAALEDAGRFQFDFDPEFQSLVIHRVDVLRDGHWTTRLDPERITLARRETDFESDMATGTVTALLDLADIRVNDIVRISYTVEGGNPVLAGLDEDEFGVGLNSPLLHRRLRVLFDAAAEPAIQHDAGIAQGSVTPIAGGLQYLEEQHALKGTRYEGDYPDWYSPWPGEQVGQKHSWAEVARWAVNLYPAPLPLPADLQQRIAAWKRDVDPAVRAANALHAVQDEVRYFGIELGENSHRPAEPADVWKHRQGDCKDKARLLVAILAQLDIAAVPALVSTKGGPDLEKALPSASAFDHVIVKAEVGGRTYWLDPTRSLQRGPLAQAAVGDFGLALPVAPGADRLVPVTQTAESMARWRITEGFVPSADGKTLHLLVRTEATGEAAEDLRGRFAQTTTERIQKDYADFYSRQFQGLSRTETLRVEDDAAANRVTTLEGYEFTGALVANSNFVTLDSYAEGIGTLLQMPSTITRQGPLALDHPVDVEERIVLTLPQHWDWRGELLQKTVDVPGIAYSLTTTRQGQDVVLLHRFRSTSSAVEPAQMDAHMRGRREVNDLVNSRFVLKAPVDVTTGQREERLHNLLKGIMDAPDDAPAPKAK